MSKKTKQSKSKYYLHNIQNNYSKNQPLSITKIEVLFDDVKRMRWYKKTWWKVLLINISLISNRQERLLKQKVIFLTFFNQYYDFHYSYLIKNDEFDTVYNKKFTIWFFIKPY